MDRNRKGETEKFAIPQGKRGTGGVKKESPQKAAEKRCAGGETSGRTESNKRTISPPTYAGPIEIRKKYRKGVE